MAHSRIRLRFAKQDDLRFISHRDLATAMERLARRVALPLAMSQGFHPHVKISFPMSLALGVAGLEEVVEIELHTLPADRDLLAEMQQAAPPGLAFQALEVVPPGTGKAHVDTMTYEMPIPAARRPAVAERIAWLRGHETYEFARAGRDAPIDLLATLVDLRIDGESLVIVQRAAHEAAAKPHDVLAALQVDDLLDEGYFLTRTRVTLLPAKRPATASP